MKKTRNLFSRWYSAAGKQISSCLLGLLSVSSIWGGSVFAQSSEGSERDGCVWKISDHDNTIYLAGSVHLLREEDYPVSSVYDAAYADSESLVMEIDMGDLMSPAGMLKMQQLGMYGGGDSLEKHLSDDAIQKVREYLNTHETGKLMALALPQMKPGMIFMTISSLEAMRLNARPDLGLEMIYYSKAQQDGKDVSGLETIEFQMSRFDQLTDPEIEELILKTLDEVEEMPKMIDDLIAAWHVGDAEALDKLMNEQMEESGKIKELLLTERNANWVPHVAKAVKGSENIMFIVGAAHLIGEDSVIDLLRKKGFRVEKVLPESSERAAKGKKKAA